MCDYSLQNVASRLAKVGDRTRLNRFPRDKHAGLCGG